MDSTITLYALATFIVGGLMILLVYYWTSKKENSKNSPNPKLDDIPAEPSGLQKDTVEIVAGLLKCLFPDAVIEKEFYPNHGDPRHEVAIIMSGKEYLFEFGKEGIEVSRLDEKEEYQKIEHSIPGIIAAMIIDLDSSRQEAGEN